MKITFLGTAAAEGIPGMFCNCRICQNALRVRGKEIKTRSQAMLDDKILIDFPADTYMHMLYHGVDLKNIHTCVITHNHMDHLYERDFWCRNKGIGNEIEEKPLHVYMTEAGMRSSQAYVEKNVQADRVERHLVTPFVPFEAEGYRFIPLKADHDQSADPVFYIIEHDGRRLLYANDTGYFPDETWEYLATYCHVFDMISLDCTGMILANYRHGHMGFSVNREVVARLTEMGLCNEKTIKYINHFSHNGGVTHEEMAARAAEYGYGVTYDGLTVEF